MAEEVDQSVGLF